MPSNAIRDLFIKSKVSLLSSSAFKTFDKNSEIK